MRVVLITNFLPPYRIPVLIALRRLLPEFKVWLSTTMEADRNWKPAWGDLDVEVQKNVTLRRSWRHPAGFVDDNLIHIPWDTFYRLIRYRPEFVISAEMGLRTIQAVWYRRLFRKTRLVIWATLSDHTEQGRGALRHWLRHWILRRVDAVIVNGKGGDRYIRQFGVPGERIFAVPQTTDLQKYLTMAPKDPESSTRVLRLIYSGRLITLKGLLPFLEQIKTAALARPSRNIELWFVGDGPLRKELEAVDLPQNVRSLFLGEQSYEKMPEYYGQCHVLMLPTLSDEWGLVVVEAMAASLPVLGSVFSQAVETLVENGKNGWTFCPADPATVQSALLALMDTSAESLRKMSANARATVDWMLPEAIAQKISDVVRVTCNL